MLTHFARSFASPRLRFASLVALLRGCVVRRSAVRSVVLLLFLLIAGHRSIVNCAGRNRPRAHVPDVIFRLIKSHSNRVSGRARVRTRMCVRVRGRAGAHAL